MTNFKKILFTVFSLGLCGPYAQAEVSTITIAHQFGLAQLPMYVMREQKLVEKQAKELGIDLQVNYVNLGTPSVVRDAFIANQIQFGVMGAPSLIGLADKTMDKDGNAEFKALASVVTLPMFLNTTENVTSVCDLKGKIGLAGVKVSNQAVTLQIATEKQCGNPTLLDSQTITMTHPDGLNAILTGQLPSHYTTLPFAAIEVAQGKSKIKTLLKSDDILGGRASFVFLVGSDKFRVENPKVYKAVLLAFEEALKWINEDKKLAAEFYLTQEKTKESVEEIIKELSDPDIRFDVTPERLGVYAGFMYRIGTVKHDMDWKALTMPEVHDKQGS